MDPLLQRIEALPKRGSFAVTLVLPDRQERIVVATVGLAGVELPEANLPACGPAALAALGAAVAAVHEARVIAGGGAAQLVDVDGGWDVSIGNVILGADGRPHCVAHGELAEHGARYECVECGAAAAFEPG